MNTPASDNATFHRRRICLSTAFCELLQLIMSDVARASGAKARLALFARLLFLRAICRTMQRVQLLSQQK